MLNVHMLRTCGAFGSSGQLDMQRGLWALSLPELYCKGLTLTLFPLGICKMVHYESSLD